MNMFTRLSIDIVARVLEHVQWMLPSNFTKFRSLHYLGASSIMPIRRTKTRYRTSRVGQSGHRHCQFEQLESRLTLSANATPFSPLTWTTLANGLPVLNSYPTAPAMIFLDYDGDVGRGSSEFDLDGTPGVFTTAEQEQIAEHWRGMAAIFSMFNVGVTTVQPNTLTIPTAWLVITNDMNTQGGVNSVNSFPDNAPSGVAGSDFWAYGFAHEVAHGFGSWHQSTYDTLGNKTAEYGPGNAPDPLHGGIMGGGYGVINKWSLAHGSRDPGSGQTDVKTIQDDMARIAADLNAVDGSGDGYRPDDQLGTSIAAATAMTIINSTTQGKVGIIERLTDQDWHSFTSTGGTYKFLVGRDNPSPVDVKVSIFDSAGMLIATVDGDPRQSIAAGSSTYRSLVNDAHLTMKLAPGTYYAKVESHGNYSDQGQYIVRVDTMSDGWQSKDLGFVGAPGFTTYSAATNSFVVAGSGRGIGGSPSQGGDAVQFAYQKLTGDGEIIARVANMDVVSDLIQAGIIIRESPATGSTYFSMFTTPSHGVHQSRRSTTDTNSSTQNSGAALFSSVWLRIKRTGNLFEGFYGADGVNWTQITTSPTIAMSADVYVGLMASAGNNNNPSNDNWVSSATFTNVTVTGQVNSPPTNNYLIAPSNVATLGATSTTVDLSWSHKALLTGDFTQNGVVDAADYVFWRNTAGSQIGYDNWRATLGVTPAVSRYWIERSSDGVNFELVGATAPNEFTFIDLGLSGNQRYFYRVVAKDAAGVSSPSAVVSAVTRAAAATNLKIYSASPTQLMIEWNDSNGEQSYKVQRSADGISGWTTVGTPTKNTPLFVNSGLTANTRYFYRVITVDASGDSATSAVVSDFTRVNSAPANFVVSGQTGTSLTLSWDALAGMTRYSIYRGRNSDNEEWLRLDSNITTTAFVDTDLQPATQYFYRVFGVNGNDGVTLKAETSGTTAAAASGVVFESASGTPLLSETPAHSSSAIPHRHGGPTSLLATDRVRNRVFEEFVLRWDSSQDTSGSRNNLAAIADADQKVEGLEAFELGMLLGEKLNFAFRRLGDSSNRFGS